MFFSQFDIFVIVAIIVLSILVNEAVIRFGKKALPSERSSHDIPTPVGAGLSFIVAFLLYWFITQTTIEACAFKSHFLGHILNNFTIGTLILGVVGIIDDHKGLSYKIRLVMQSICGFILVSPSNFEGFFMVFCILGLINSTNFVDGLNGLLSGCWLIGMIFSGIVLYLSKDFDLIITFVPIFISVLVFFIYNFPKAKVFMGDVGSTFLGFTLGLLLLFGQKGNSEYFFILNKKPIVLLMPFAFLWFDVLFTLCNRIKKRVPITYSHRDYIFHKLIDRGFSQTKISLLYFALTLIVGFLTVLYFIQLINFLTLLFFYCALQIFVVVISQKNK